VDDRRRPRLAGARLPGILATIAGGDGSGRVTRPVTRGQLIAHRMFWTAFVLATVVLWLDDRRVGRVPGWLPGPLRLALSPLLLAGLWFAVLRRREPLRRALRWPRLPAPVTYLVAGVPLVTLAVAAGSGFGLFGPDDPRLTVARELGPWLGLLVAVWFAWRHYALTPPHVFWLLGGLGSVAAQRFALPVALWQQHWLTALLLFCYAVPVYGGGIALVLHVMPPEQAPGGQARVGWRAAGLAAAGMAVAFTVLAFGWSALVSLAA